MPNSTLTLLGILNKTWQNWTFKSVQSTHIFQQRSSFCFGVMCADIFQFRFTSTEKNWDFTKIKLFINFFSSVINLILHYALTELNQLHNFNKFNNFQKILSPSEITLSSRTCYTPPPIHFHIYSSKNINKNALKVSKL